MAGTVSKKTFPENKALNLPEFDKEVLALWASENTFQKSIDKQADKGDFVFYEGPPSANGIPGIHHVMARAVKDLFCRYKTQQGFRVQRKAGWDTHGLPVELQVEKELGIKKEDIGTKISIEDFNQKCREAVMRFTDKWEEMTSIMGYWVDMDDPYVTYDSKYIETLWYLLSELYKKGLLYKGFTIQPYSPAAGTGLSSHELNQPGTYRDVKDTSITVQFEADMSDEKTKAFADKYGVDSFSFLAWTTTPWTLPGNSALTVGDKLEYALIKTHNPYSKKEVSVVLAKELVGKYFKKGEAALAPGSLLEDGSQVVSIVPGKDLLGLRYHQLFPYVTPKEEAFKVIAGDFVTTEDGTGIVHTSPTFGADDYRVAQQNGIPSIMVQDEFGKPMPIVDKQGRFVKEITDFAGLYVKNYDNQDESSPDYKSTDLLIALKLKEEGKAFKIEKYEHPYPHCWRTDKPLLYYPMASWFIKTTELKAKLIELNKPNHINWKPESTGTGRFGNWLENLVDWNLSRSRFWGTPLPIWRSEDGLSEVCIGSISDLKVHLEEASNSSLLSKLQSIENTAYLQKMHEGTFDLHRPYVDGLWLVKDGKVLSREPDLVDVWFDSGAMPYAQNHYPFAPESVVPGKFMNGLPTPAQFPANFIAEGVDQTRGWFFTLHALGTLLFGSEAFKNVISNGLVLDKDGNKMSKRLGNTVDPFEIIKAHGADSVRWYLITNAAPWDNLKFNPAGIEEVKRRFFGTLYNTYQFFALYANLDGISISDLEEGDLTSSEPIDVWAIKRLNQLIADVTASLDDFDPTPAGRAIQEFVNEDLSNWYVRLNRKRFWKGSLDADKMAAYKVLYHSLKTVAQLMAPIAPFYSEKLFRDLTGKESVHLSQWPTPFKTVSNDDILAEMADVRTFCALIHGVRKKHTIKVRRPLSRVLIPASDLKLQESLMHLSKIIQQETNIKHIEVLDQNSDIIHKSAKLNFKRLGKTLGPAIQQVAEKVKKLTSAEIDAFEDAEFLLMEVNGQTVTLGYEDIEVFTADVPGWIIAREGTLTVAIDLKMTDELVQEGLAREFVNRIQNLRKDKDFDVQDRISIQVLSELPEVTTALQNWQDYIKEEVQADNLLFGNGKPHTTADLIDVDDFQIELLIEKAPAK